MDSYRVEKKAVLKIALVDDDAEIEPVPTDGGGRRPEPELDRLSNILKTFNEQFGTLFTDTDRVVKRIREDIAPKVAADVAYKNAKENTPHTARMAHDQALGKVMQLLLRDDTQVYKQFVENESFGRFVSDLVYEITRDGDLATRLRESGDPRDDLAAHLLPLLETGSRLTLADALEAAEGRGLTAADAFTALERLGCLDNAYMRRFFVDRSNVAPVVLESKEVAKRLGAPDRGLAWASSVDVVWAASVAGALDCGAVE